MESRRQFLIDGFVFSKCRHETHDAFVQLLPTHPPQLYIRSFYSCRNSVLHVCHATDENNDKAKVFVLQGQSKLLLHVKCAFCPSSMSIFAHSRCRSRCEFLGLVRVVFMFYFDCCLISRLRNIFLKRFQVCPWMGIKYSLSSVDEALPRSGKKEAILGNKTHWWYQKQTKTEVDIWFKLNRSSFLLSRNPSAQRKCSCVSCLNVSCGVSPEILRLFFRIETFSYQMKGNVSEASRRSTEKAVWFHGIFLSYSLLRCCQLFRPCLTSDFA